MADKFDPWGGVGEDDSSSSSSSSTSSELDPWGGVEAPSGADYGSVFGFDTESPRVPLKPYDVPSQFMDMESGGALVSREFARPGDVPISDVPLPLSFDRISKNTLAEDGSVSQRRAGEMANYLGMEPGPTLKSGQATYRRYGMPKDYPFRPLETESWIPGQTENGFSLGELGADTLEGADNVLKFGLDDMAGKTGGSNFFTRGAKATGAGALLGAGTDAAMQLASMAAGAQSEPELSDIVMSGGKGGVSGGFGSLANSASAHLFKKDVEQVLNQNPLDRASDAYQAENRILTSMGIDPSDQTQTGQMVPRQSLRRLLTRYKDDFFSPKSQDLVMGAKGGDVVNDPRAFSDFVFGTPDAPGGTMRGGLKEIVSNEFEKAVPEISKTAGEIDLRDLSKAVIEPSLKDSLSGAGALDEVTGAARAGEAGRLNDMATSLFEGIRRGAVTESDDKAIKFLEDAGKGLKVNRDEVAAAYGVAKNAEDAAYKTFSKSTIEANRLTGLANDLQKTIDEGGMVSVEQAIQRAKQIKSEIGDIDAMTSYYRTLGGPKAIAEKMNQEATGKAIDRAMSVSETVKAIQAQKALKLNAKQLSGVYDNITSQLEDFNLAADARKSLEGQLRSIESEMASNSANLAKFESEAGMKINFTQARGIKKLLQTRADNVGAFNDNANLDGQFYKNMLVRMGEWEDNLVKNKVLPENPELANKFLGIKQDFRDIQVLDDLSKTSGLVNAEQGNAVRHFASIPANSRDLIHTTVPRMFTQDRIKQYREGMRSFGLVRPDTGNVVTDAVSNLTHQGIVPSVANLIAKGDAGRLAVSVAPIINPDAPAGNIDDLSSQFLESITAHMLSKGKKEFEGLPPEEQEKLLSAKRDQVVQAVAPILQAKAIGDQQGAEEALSNLMKTPQAKELGLAIIPKSGMAGEIEVSGKRKLPVYEDAVKYANKAARDSSRSFGERFDAHQSMVKDRVVK